MQALIMRAGIVVNVTRADRLRLEAIIADRSTPQKHVWHANVILATADGCGTAEIMRRSGKSRPVVWTWQARFMAEGVEGLLRDKTRKPGKPPLPPNTVQRIVDLALGPPPGESTHWTGRDLAKAAGVSLRSVQRILEAYQLAPHRIRTFKLSKDPEFVEKLRDIVGLYVDPPAHANAGARPHPARSADEEGPRWDDDPRLQTPWHNDAVRRPQCARRHRHRPQHAAPPAPGVHPLPQHRRGAGAGANAIHAVVDNYATPKHPKVQKWLARHPRWTFHFTPTSMSWLNAVEGFFAKLTRDGASSVECSGRLPTFRLPSTGSLKKPTPIPNPSSGPLTPNASSPLSNEGKKS